MRYTRRDNVALPFGLALTAATALGWNLAGRLDVGARYPFQAAAAFALMTALVLAAGEPHHHSRFGPANIVTTVRAVLAALVAGLIGLPVSVEALWWVMAATTAVAVLDGVDGWLARRTQLASPFGARFDMETDAFLILALSLLVWQHGKAGPWVLLCGLMRYLFVAAGWMLGWLARPLRSTMRGKSVAIGQIVGLGVALMPAVRPPASASVAFVTLATLAWSFGLDVRWLWRSHLTGRSDAVARD